MRTCIKNLYYAKFEVLKQMDKFVDALNLFVLGQDEISNFKSSTESSAIEIATKNFQQKYSGLDRFSTQFYQNFRELTPLMLRDINEHCLLFSVILLL